MLVCSLASVRRTEELQNGSWAFERHERLTLLTFGFTAFLVQCDLAGAGRFNDTFGAS